jgi:hypothetical protein
LLNLIINKHEAKLRKHPAADTLIPKPLTVTGRQRQVNAQERGEFVNEG